MPRVEISKMTKRFNGFAAVEDVTMFVDDKEYVSIIGPSGCGKTTLLRCVAGILRQDEGEVRINGKSMKDEPIEERGVGYVFQDIALFPHMALWDNVSYGPRAKGAPPRRTRAIAIEMLEMMNLSDRQRDFPHQLSGGMQQKAAVARAVAPGHSLMLFDEPLSMLDARVRSALRFELRRIVKDLGLTAIHVTHDQEEAMAISDRIFVMRKGIIIESGRPSDLYFRPRRLFTAYFLGESNILPGRVLGSEGGRTEVFVGRFALRASEGSVKEGERAVVVVRPELVELDGEQDENCLTGKVRSRTFEGPFARYLIEIGTNLFLKVKVPARRGNRLPEKGEITRATFRWEDLLIYEYPSGGLNTEIGW